MRKETYNKYFNKLVDYCKLLNIQLFVSEVEEDSCDLDKRVIIISTKQKKNEQIAAILHEIGHIIDFLHNKKIFKKANAYNALIKNNHELTNSERKQLILLEQRAWDYAESLCLLLNINIQLIKLDTIKRSCLSTYYAIRVKPRNSRKAKG